MKINRMPVKLVASVTDSIVTKRVKLDFNRLTEHESAISYIWQMAV